MRFVVEPRLLDHFGVAMYANVAKAIAELGANAYDAAASAVQVTVAEDEIIVSDDGRGMTPEEVEGGYLPLGRDRRVDDGLDRTRDRNRPVIG
jgi:signal transduction histidine kinase